MAKIGLSKILTKKIVMPKIVVINEQEITVLQYLNIDDKAALIQRVLNNAADEVGTFSPVRLRVYFDLELVRCYSNLNITETQWNNISKLYDSFMINNIFTVILDAIPQSERIYLWNGLLDCAKNISQYNSSFVGMMRAINSDKALTEDNIQELLKQLGDPEQFATVKDILTKL